MGIPWHNSEYAKAQTITIDSTDISANLTDFPFLVKIEDSHGIAIGDIAAKRFCFYDHNGTRLDFDPDDYSEGATYANAEVWVRVPTLYASPTGNQNEIYIYYGSDPGVDEDNGADVWESNFKAVYHFGTDDDSGGTGDASGNSHTLTNTGADDAAGKIGRARSFVSANTDYMYAADHDDWDFTAEFIISVWGKIPDPGGNDGNFFYRYDNSPTEDGYFFKVESSDDTGYFGLWQGSSYDSSATDSTPDDDAWHLFHCLRISDSTTVMYVDSVLQADSGAANSGTVIGDNAFNWGAAQFGGGAAFKYLNGDMDEARVYDGLPTNYASWIAFEYANVNEADNAATWGGERLRAGVKSNFIVTPTILSPSIVRLDRDWHQLRNDLVAYYSPRTLSADSYTWSDDSGDGHDGTLTNMTPSSAWVSGPHGRALDFNPSAPDYVETGTPLLAGLTELTVSCRFRADVNNRDHDLIAEGNHGANEPFFVWRDNYAGGDRYSVYITDSDGHVTGALNTVDGSAASVGVWQHVAVTFKGGDSVNFYLDGKPDAGNPQSIATVDNVKSGDTLRIGANAHAETPNATDGKIDFAAIWSRALAPWEIALLAENPLILETPEAPVDDWALFTGAVSVGSVGVTLAPDPVACPASIPAATVLIPTTLTPDPVAAPVVVPAVSISMTLAPDPVAAPVVVPAASIVMGLALTPDPVAVPVVVPATTRGVKLTPDAVACPVVLPAMTISTTAMTLSMTPVACPVLLPAAVLAMGTVVRCWMDRGGVFSSGSARGGISRPRPTEGSIYRPGSAMGNLKE